MVEGEIVVPAKAKMEVEVNMKAEVEVKWYVRVPVLM